MTQKKGLTDVKMHTSARYLLFRNTFSILSKDISLSWHHLILDITNGVVFSNTLVRKIVYLVWFVNAFGACEDFCHRCSCFQKSWDKVIFLYLGVGIIYSDSLACASVPWLHSVKEIKSDIQRCCLLTIIWSI